LAVTEAGCRIVLFPWDSAQKTWIAYMDKRFHVTDNPSPYNSEAFMTIMYIDCSWWQYWTWRLKDFLFWRVWDNLGKSPVVYLRKSKPAILSITPSGSLTFREFNEKAQPRWEMTGKFYPEKKVDRRL
jgi:hypothetical protein